MKEKFYRFMAGRYGLDQFGRFLNIAALVVIVLNLFFRNNVLWLIGLALIVWSDVRMFSRNMEKRRSENEKYLRLSYRVTGRVRDWKERWRQRRDYCFFRCPSCKAMLRVPRGKGRIRVTCRKCGTAFERRT